MCDAVPYAHAQGVIHRDIKPLNILVTPAGVPKLLDFGIAKVLHDAADEITSTVTGLRLLTPEYASPEQVEGRHATTASDVYSLGVVLYELLTGRSPYRLPSRAPQDVAAAVCTTEPERPSAAVTRPIEPGGDAMRRRRRDATSDHPAATGATTARQLSRLLRGDLDTIVLAALRKEPARRYPSVAALAEDLRRHLDGRPVVGPERRGALPGGEVRPAAPGRPRGRRSRDGRGRGPRLGEAAGVRCRGGYALTARNPGAGSPRSAPRGRLHRPHRRRHDPHRGCDRGTADRPRAIAGRPDHDRATGARLS